MPKIFKHFLKPNVTKYILPNADELIVKKEPPKEETLSQEEVNEPSEEQAAEALEVTEQPEAVKEDETEPEEKTKPEEDIISFAQVQAEAILRDAKQEAEEYIEQYKEEALRNFEEELESRRQEAHEQGYQEGFSYGMTEATEQAKIEREQLAAEQMKTIEIFLEQAAKERDRLLDNSREELKDLALAIAEKVIQISLKNSSDIILKMVDAATDTHKRCEWAHIYIADCDIKGKANTIPELAAALGHISERVRIIPMADDESGTCIVELPDVILDASVSTQLDNIREVLTSTGLDPTDNPFFNARSNKKSPTSITGL